YLPRIGQVENMSVEGLFVHGGDLWRLNTPLSCLQPPQQGKTHMYTALSEEKNDEVHSCSIRSQHSKNSFVHRAMPCGFSVTGIRLH
ncbi:hypothetical protein QM085_28535, partial [Klebsiella pneumoniae]